MKPPKHYVLSVCIPHYNGGHEIERCLHSLSRPKKDYSDQVEIVVVDDKSSDGSLSVLRRYERTGIIRLVQNDENLGLTGNWNKALKQGKGDVVCQLHQDDWYEPGTVQYILDTFNRHDNLAFLATGQIFHPSDGSLPKTVPRGNLGTYTGRDYFRRCMTFYDIPAPSTAFFSRRHLQALDIYYHNRYRYCSEMDLYIRLALAHPQAEFRHDDNNPIHRGLTKKRFSFLHPGYRILDFCRIFERYSASLGEEDLPEAAEAVRRNITHDLQKVAQLNDVRHTAEILEDERFQNWLRTDERNYSVLAQAKINIRIPFQQENTVDNRDKSKVTLPSINEVEKYLLQPIFIVGFHHSGTRLIAELLQQMDVFQVIDRKTYEWGYIQDLNDEILPEWFNPQAVRDFEAHRGSVKISTLEISQKLVETGYRFDKPWGHKDPRTCSTIDAWLEVFPEARVVHLVRDPLDVLGTLPAAYDKFTPDHLDPRSALGHWADLWTVNIDTVTDIKNKVSRFIEIRFEDLCLEPVQKLLEIASALELTTTKLPDISQINTRKIGVYQEWLQDGRLTQDSIDFLTQRLDTYRKRFEYVIAEKTPPQKLPKDLIVDKKRLFQSSDV